MSASFLFRNLFTPEKQVASAANAISNLTEANDGPELFAKKLASQVYQTKKMDGVSIPSWDNFEDKEAEKSIPAIIKFVHPVLDAFLAAKIPTELKDSRGTIRQIFLAYLTSLVRQKSSDVKADIKKLKAPSLIGKTDDGMDDIRKDLAGIRFKVPTKDPSILYILKTVGDAVDKELIKQQVTHNVIKNNIRLKEFFASLQDAVNEQAATKLQFFSLARKDTDAKTKEQASDMAEKIRYGNRAVVAYTTMVFPFMNPNTVAKILKGTGSFFPITGQRYQGVVLNNAAFSPDTDFSTFTQIADPVIKNALINVKKTLSGNSEFSSHINKAGSVLYRSVLKNSILSPRVQKRIAKSMYYSVVSALSPTVLNFAEIDNNKFMPNYTRNMVSTPEFLSPAANSALIAAVKHAEESPAILQGLHGKNARQQMAIDLFLNKKAAGLFNKKGGMTDANIKAALAVVLDDPKIGQINDIFTAWLASNDPKAASDAMVDKIKSLVTKYAAQLVDTNSAGVLDLPKYDASLLIIESLLTHLKEVTSDDFQAVKTIQQQLINYFASESPAKEELGKESEWASMSAADKHLEYKLMFEKFNDYLQAVSKENPIRGEALYSLLNLSNIHDSLEYATNQLSTFQKSDKLVAKTLSRKRTLAAKLMASVSLLVQNIDLDHLFSTPLVLGRIEKNVLRYAKLINPRDITEPIAVGEKKITSSSNEEDIKAAIMSVISASLPTEAIVKILKELKIPSSYNNAAASIMNDILIQIESPSIAIGSSIDPIYITPNSTVKHITRQIKTYIQTQSVDLSARVISDLTELDKKQYGEDGATNSITDKLDAATAYIEKTLSDHSPEALSVTRAIRSDAARTDKRREAVQRIKVISNAGSTLSNILDALVISIESAPENIQFMLKGINTDANELKVYFEEELRNILLDPAINAEPLFKADRMTFDMAFASAAEDLVNQTLHGKIYKDSTIIQSIPFADQLPKSLGVLINLSAALKEYNGVTIKDGYLSFDIDFDSISAKYGVLTILDTLDKEYSISARLSTSVISKLATQSYFFHSLADVFSQFTPSISSDTFIQADLKKDFTNLSADIDLFINEIKQGPDLLNKLAANIDAHILERFAGVSVPLFTKDSVGNIVGESNKTLIVPTSIDDSFSRTITAIASNAMFELRGGSTKAAALKTVLESLANKEQSIQAFTEAMQLIQSLIVVEIGKKYADIDELARDAVNFVASSMPEEEGIIINGINALSHLAGSLDTALHTKHILKGTNQIVHVINPLINSILDLFSFETTGITANKEPEDKELLAFERGIKGGKLNRTNKADLHKKEGSGTFTSLNKSFLQIADVLGIAYKEFVESTTSVIREPKIKDMPVTEGAEEDILRQRLAKINQPTETSMEPEIIPLGQEANTYAPGGSYEQQAIANLSKLLGIDLPSSGFYVSDPKQPLKVLQIDKTKVTAYQSVAKRLYGGYVGPTAKGGQQYQRFANVKSFLEYLDETKKVTREVLDIFTRIYNNPTFAQESGSLAKHNKSLLKNLVILRKMLVTLAEEQDGTPIMATIEGQNKFFLLMKEIEPLPIDSITKEITKEVKGKSVTKQVTTRMLDPIQKILAFPLSEQAVDGELDAIGSYLGGSSNNTGVLELLRPIVEGQLSWDDVIAAFNGLSDNARYISIAGEHKNKVSGIVSNTDKIPTKREHEYLATFMNDLKTVIISLNNDRRNGVLNSTYDFSTNLPLLSVYATLFSSNTIKELPSAVQAEMKKKATELASLITREEQIKIEQAIKTNPQPAILLNKINTARKAEMNNPENTEMLAQIQADNNDLNTNNLISVTDNPFRIIGSLQNTKVSNDVNENISIALSLLSLNEDIAKKIDTNLAEEVAMNLYSAVYKHNNGDALPQERTDGQINQIVPMPILDFENDVLVVIEPHLWILPLMSAFSYSKVKQFTSIFTRKEQFQFITADDTNIYVTISDFTKMSTISDLFTPLQQNEETDNDL